MTTKVNNQIDERMQSEVIAQREEAFRKGFNDYSRGVDREKNPYGPGHADLRRSWRAGWDKSKASLNVALPK